MSGFFHKSNSTYKLEKYVCINAMIINTRNMDFTNPSQY